MEVYEENIELSQGKKCDTAITPYEGPTGKARIKELGIIIKKGWNSETTLIKSQWQVK